MQHPDSDPDQIARSTRRRMVWAFLLLVLVMGGGAFGYWWLGWQHEPGHWTFNECLYMTAITVTTVGYGDLAPRTVLGQTIASIAMILGYAVIAVPTGIISAEWANAVRIPDEPRVCAACGLRGHAEEALYCRSCGTILPDRVKSGDGQ
jgi:voltage-gated potassium channel